ncbi:MAG TPA: hypothetical protein VI731_09870 [Bacteroidia bacterium]|nr:hypothetical protein [Bacteroidia bacterium]
MKTITSLFTGTFRREEDLLSVSPPRERFDWKVAVILIWTALGLSIIRYYGEMHFVIELLEECGFEQACAALRHWGLTGEDARLHSLT